MDLTALSGVLPERFEERVSFQRHELQMRRADGTAIRVSVTKTVWRTPTGEPVIDGLLEEVAQPPPGMPQTERRRWPRVEAHLEMSVRPDGEPSSGTAPNISLGGVYVVLDRPVPITENQPIQLGLVTDTAFARQRATWSLRLSVSNQALPSSSNLSTRQRRPSSHRSWTDCASERRR